MSKVVVAATNNRGKVKEIKKILDDMGWDIKSLADLELLIDVVEDADTFEGNAIKKASEVAALTGLMTIADDSGLMVDALDGRPGVYSARFAPNGQRTTTLLSLMNDVPDEKRGAKFVSCVALCNPDGVTITAHGIVEGRITRERRGDGGFGYDPIFIPYGYDLTFAQLDSGVKNKISHRYNALNALRDKIGDMI